MRVNDKHIKHMLFIKGQKKKKQIIHVSLSPEAIVYE